MRSFLWIISLLCLAATCSQAMQHSLKKKYSYSSDYEIIFDEDALKNNSLVYGACRIKSDGKDMSCSIALRSFPDAKKIHESTCQINYKIEEERNISRKFRLKKLFKNYTAFVWTDEKDSSPGNLVLDIINMDDCKSQNYIFRTQIEDFHMVVYDRIFDVYYPDERHCGKFLCGETFDWRGRVLNGPAISYLPSEYFNGKSHMCSVQSRSSVKGHFVITPSNFYLVTADYGKKYQMGNLPIDTRIAMYTCNNEYLGYCWVTEDKESNTLCCQQFNSKGEHILSTVESLNYNPGTWMSMQNLGPSELLILNNECIGSCTSNTEQMQFHVLKIMEPGKARILHQFQGLECDNAKDVRSEVVQKDKKEICVTIACHTRNANSYHSVNFLSTCFSD